MRVLMLIALILAVLALICAAVPRTILGADWSVWLCAAFVAFFLDLLIGGWAKLTKK